MPCRACAGDLEEGIAFTPQSGFPFSWGPMPPELNGPEGRSVIGWGGSARRSSELRKAFEARTLPVAAARCRSCGLLEYYARPKDG